MKVALWALSVFSVSLVIGVEMLSLPENKHQFSTHNSYSMNSGYWMGNERTKRDFVPNFGTYFKNKREILELKSNAENGIFLETPNYASLLGYKIFNPNDADKYIIPKKQKPIPCPRIFNPVCATFAEVKSTFINECLVNAENVKTGKNWKIFSQGICEEDFSVMLPKMLKRSEGTYKHSQPYKWSNIESHWDLGDDVTYITAPSRFQTQFITSQNPEKIIRDFNKQKPEPLQESQPNADTSFESQISTYDPPQNIVHPQRAYKNVLTDVLKVFQNPKPQQYYYRPMIPTNNNRFAPTDSIFNKPMSTKNIVINSSCSLGNTPICARHGWYTQTFKDICQLKSHNRMTGQNWQIAHEGECRNCLLECPKTFDPVCASRNGIEYTFQNECLLRSLNCMTTRTGWKFIKNGVCNRTEEQSIKDKYEFIKPGFRYKSSYKTTLKATHDTHDISTTTNAITTTENPTSKKVLQNKLDNNLQPKYIESDNKTATTKVMD